MRQYVLFIHFQDTEILSRQLTLKYNVMYILFLSTTSIIFVLKLQSNNNGSKSSFCRTF